MIKTSKYVGTDPYNIVLNLNVGKKVELKNPEIVITGIYPEDNKIT